MNNLSKALELLQLPEDCGQFEGQVTTKTSRHIIINEIQDYTVSPKKITTEVRSAETTQLFGVYTLNLLSMYLHAYGHEVEEVGEGIMKTNKERVFSDSSRWFPWQKVSIEPTTNGHSYDVISDIGLNAVHDPFGGGTTDFNNPPVRAGVFYKTITTITKSGTGAIKVYTGKKKYVNWTVSQLVEATGMSEAELAVAARTTFNSVKVNPDTHITSIAMGLERPSETSVKGVFHVNGVPVTGSLMKITSYNKMCPSFKFRWNLYNRAGVNAYGSSVMVEFAANADNTINFVAGTTDSFNPDTSTLTYDESLPTNANLVGYAEFLPAQGKNENAGRTIVLESGLEEIW